MRKLSIYFLSLTCGFTLLTSCSDDDSPTPVLPVSHVQPVVDAAVSGTWKISYFYDTDSEETSNYQNYNFTFGAGNVLTATNGTNTYAGSWSVTNSDNSNDDSNNSNDIDFNINFASPASFVELSDDWDIISYSSTKIELVDVSGGNGGTDYLTFQKVQ